jgi:hypothetical protein
MPNQTPLESVTTAIYDFIYRDPLEGPGRPTQGPKGLGRAKGGLVPKIAERQ